MDKTMSGPDSQTAVALDVGGTFMRAALISPDGDILFRRSIDTPSSRSIPDVVNRIRDLVGQALDAAAERNKSVVGCGLGLPGFLLMKEEKVYWSPNFPDWRDAEIGKLLRKAMPVPFRFHNDGNLSVLGEWWKGSGQGYHHVITLTLGTGVGGGILINDRLLTGTRGAGGEVGHICVDPQGPLCGCGGKGCLEVMASGTALERKSGKLGLVLEKEARSGDKQALRYFEEMGRYLGIGLSSLCFLFEPQIIVLSGKVSRAFEFFSPAMREEMDSQLKNHPAKTVQVVLGKYIDDAVLLGAAWLVYHGSIDN